MKSLKLLLSVLLCTGTTTLSLAQAELQVIHNCADPAAAQVDVYVNGTLTLDDFAFREATSFLPVPSGVQLNIGIAPGNSTSANDTLVNIPVTLVANEKYTAIASGVLNPAAFASNPSGRATGFRLLLTAGMRTAALNSTDVDFRVLHGATDAPAVDVAAQGVATLVSGAAYTDITSYISVPADDYVLDVIPSGTSTPLISYAAPLTGLAGGSAFVFASGFLDPSQNQNGEGFGLFAALANGTVIPLNVVGTARLQVIHNAADPAAEKVDVYLNGALLLNDFEFRTATPFVDVPSGLTLNIGIAPSTSTSANDTLVNIPVLLNDGETYVAIANGVLNPANFAANPSSISTAFRLLLFDGMQEAAVNASEVDFRVLHGATDAPAVDIAVQNGPTLVSAASYTDFTSYINVAAADYVLDIIPTGTTTALVSYIAPLSGLAGGSAVVFASGFLTPSANQNGEAFGVYAALANGTVVALNAAGDARLQVIHNAADPAAEIVDVYVNGSLLLDDFGFRSATPFIDVPGGVTLNIGIAPGNSTSADDTLVNIPVLLTAGETYVAVANGVLAPGSFAANPQGVSTAFRLLLFDDMQEDAALPANVDLAILHGATDAPAVDVYARGVAQLVDSAAYTDLAGYLAVPAANYLIDITPAAGSPILATYVAPLSGLAGGAAVVFASGFLTPSANQNGAAFGLFAALPNGTVIELSDTSLARLQVIHNCADPAADSVDIYVNGGLLLNNFAFRTATPYVTVPAGVTLSIGVAGKNSSSVNDTLVSFNVTLDNGNTYTAIASGVLAPASFAVNPDGRPTGFTLLLQDKMREAASVSSNVEFRVVHGSTDAPTVDVVAVGAGVIVNDAAYTDITAYLGVPAANYTLNITPGNNNNVVVASFVAPLSPLAGGAATVFASGFLTPSANQNGAAFGLFAALPTGQVVAFQNVTGVDENQVQLVENLYPNPANDVLQIRVKDNAQVEALNITDITGKVVKVQNLPMNSNGIVVDLNGIEAGTYFINLFDGKQMSSRMFQIVR